MKLFMTTIYDHIAKSYTTPAYSVNTAMAVRAFAHAANDPTHVIGQHPGDFSMFVLGEFDDETAQVVAYSPMQSLGLAASYVKKVNHVQYKKSPKPNRHEAQLQPSAAGGNSSQQLRPEPRAQDDVRRGVPDPDPS